MPPFEVRRMKMDMMKPNGKKIRRTRAEIDMSKILFIGFVKLLFNDSSH